MARRGVPNVIVNDNFKTFKAVEVKQFMVSYGITPLRSITPFHLLHGRDISESE